MAEAFAPDIGMDIGASNVTVKSGTSVDFSSVGKALGSMFEKPTVSEADIKRATFAPLSQGIQRIQEDPNISDTERKVKTSLFVSQWANANPQYSSEAKSYLGLQEEVAKATMSPLDQTVSDWESIAENKDMAAGFSISSLNPDGSKDEKKYKTLVINAIQMESRKDQLASVAAATKEEGTNIWENDPKQGYQASVAFIIADADQTLNNEMFSKGLIAAGQNGTTLDPAMIQDNFVIPTVNILEDRKRRAGEDLDKQAIALKQDISSAEYVKRKELALAPYQDKIDFLNTNKDNFAEYSKRLTAVKDVLVAQENIDSIQASKLLEEAAAVYVGPETAKVLVRTKEGKQALNNQLVTALNEPIGKLANDLVNRSKGSELMGVTLAKGMTPSTTTTSYIQMYVPQTEMGADGGPVNRDAATLSPAEIKMYTEMPSGDKASVVTSGIAVIKNIDAVTDANIPYAMDVVGNTLNMSLLTDTPKLNAAQVKAFYNPSFFNFVNKIGDKPLDPKVIEGYTQKADASVQLQLSRDWADVSAQLRTIETALGGGKIFGVAIVDGKYTPTFVKDFEKTNPEVRKKMLYEKIKTPQELIASYSRVPWYGGRAVDTTKLDSTLESINFISTNLIKLPPEVASNFKTSYSYSKEQMGVFNSQVETSGFETKVEVSKVEPKIPEEYKSKLPQLMEYYTLKDKFIASTDPQEKATLTQSLTNLKNSLGMQTMGEAKDPSAVSSRNPWDLSFPNGKTARAIEEYYQAKVSEGLVTTAAASAPRRIRWTDIVQGSQGGAGR